MLEQKVPSGPTFHRPPPIILPWALQSESRGVMPILPFRMMTGIALSSSTTTSLRLVAGHCLNPAPCSPPVVPQAPFHMALLMTPAFFPRTNLLFGGT